MSSGKTHAKISMCAAPVTAIVVAITTHNVWNGALAGAGCVLGVIVSPDLDVDHRTYSETVLPGVLGWVWTVYWWPYSRMFKHRESSHWVIIGTVLRVLYGFWWLPLLCGVNLTDLLWLWIGLAVSDALHWIADTL